MKFNILIILSYLKLIIIVIKSEDLLYIRIKVRELITYLNNYFREFKKNININFLRKDIMRFIISEINRF